MIVSSRAGPMPAVAVRKQAELRRRLTVARKALDDARARACVCGTQAGACVCGAS